MGGVITAVFVLAAAIALWWFLGHKQLTTPAKNNSTIQETKKLTPQQEAKLREPIDINSYGSTDNDMAKLAEKEGPKYDYAREKLTTSNPAKWDKPAVDLAYGALVYADKVGDYSTAAYVLVLLKQAGQAGVNIDDNSYNMHASERDAIAGRVSAYLQP